MLVAGQVEERREREHLPPELERDVAVVGAVFRVLIGQPHLDARSKSLNVEVPSEKTGTCNGHQAEQGGK